ncbi:calmodulin-binding protein 25-like [Melia azedarach]|uniref:Calmodulin-binding protein 25-like n=1 Tax=Melia azedarach TaxID=155640 RepID=A0ACC1X947_MELAZ|nr:calmodulin-binding protein 25-like [Melia azedarach]
MTSSENLPNIESWAFRSAFADSWLSDAFARDTETLTKALQKSFSNSDNSVCETFASDFIAPYIVNQETPTVSNVSGSEPETLPKRQRPAMPGPNSGKITKRKSRASKRTQTTFITADPANFRQMVQQVTGVKFGNSQVSMAPILKPEPHRPGSRLAGLGGAGGCLPTLDTSAFLLDHQHHQQVAASSGSISGAVIGSGQYDFQVGEGGTATGLDFEAISSFPTLESWT